MPPKKKVKKVKSYKTSKNVPKAPKRRKVKPKNTDGGFLQTVKKPNKVTKPSKAKTKAKKTTYSPEGEWITNLQGLGSSRRNPNNKKRNEKKPYSGW